MGRHHPPVKGGPRRFVGILESRSRRPPEARRTPRRRSHGRVVRRARVTTAQRVHRAFRYEISTASGERGPNQADDARRGELDAPRFADLVCLPSVAPCLACRLARSKARAGPGEMAERQRRRTCRFRWGKPVSPSDVCPAWTMPSARPLPMRCRFRRHRLRRRAAERRHGRPARAKRAHAADEDEGLVSERTRPRSSLSRRSPRRRDGRRPVHRTDPVSPSGIDHESTTNRPWAGAQAWLTRARSQGGRLEARDFSTQSRPRLHRLFDWHVACPSLPRHEPARRPTRAGKDSFQR